MRIPRGLGLMMMGFAGLFGIRTPPDPETIAHMAPVKGSEDPHGRGGPEEDPPFEVATRGERPPREP
jgi:hypothetical protein